MKTLHDYISESETWATTPMPGDDFAIELAPDHLIESYVVETLDDGIVIEADAHAMSLLEEYGCMTETIRRYGPVGSNRGVGFTVAEEKPAEVDEHGGGISPQQRWQDLAEVDRMMELAGIAKSPVEEDNSGLAQKAVSLAPVGAMGTEIDEAYGNSIDFQGRQVDRASIELDGVHSWDYPDFSDAYVSYATFTDGTPLSDNELDQFTDQHGDLVNELAYDSLHEGTMDEAKYHGREVPLGKPMAGDVKKSKVYVRDPATGNIKKVNFGHGGTSAKRAGQKPMHIKKDNPARRRSFRARHHCENPGPRTKARYWSCRAW